MREWRGVLVLLVLGAFVAADSHARPQKRRSARNRASEPITLDVNAINQARQDSSTDMAAIVRAQILLDRAHFSPGEIDGKAGKNFERALSAFQQARKLQTSGSLDAGTWAELNSDSEPALTPYRITEADVAGPFVPVPEDMLAKAKLEALTYSSIEEALGERFHIDPELLKRINPEKSMAAGEEINVPNVAAAPTGKAEKVIVTKDGTVSAIDLSGAVIAFYPASSGSEHDPLPIGTWKINGVAKNPPFHYNPELFWDADPKHSKARIAPGPNNPVGVVWIDLSKEHYGIHGTPNPSEVGHAQSHGCIRLTNWDAMELASLVAPGVPAILTE